MLYLTASPGDKLVLGRSGENLARTVRIDITRWRAMYGDGVAALLLRRPGEADPYPCAIEQDDGMVTWPITLVETAIPGTTGRYELQYRVGDQLVKSAAGIAVVYDTLVSSTDELPGSQQGWVDQVLTAGAAAQTAADRAEAATVNVPKLSDSDTWMVWDPEKGEYADTGVYSGGNAPGIDPTTGNWVIGGEDTGIHATGPQGPKGDTGATGPQGPKGDAATIQIVDTQTVDPETPATLTETADSTPQDRRYIASIPKGDPGKDGVVDVSLGLPAAAPGDIIRVKATDDKGRPTEWEAGDFGTLKKIGEVTTEEEVKAIEMDLGGEYETVVVMDDMPTAPVQGVLYIDINGVTCMGLDEGITTTELVYTRKRTYVMRRCEPHCLSIRTGNAGANQYSGFQGNAAGVGNVEYTAGKFNRVTYKANPHASGLVLPVGTKIQVFAGG